MWPFGKKKSSDITTETRTNEDGSTSVTTRFTLDKDTEVSTVDEAAVEVLDEVLAGYGNNLLHAMDPSRMLSFLSGGPPVWSVGLVEIEGPQPYLLAVSYGFSHLIAPEPMREPLHHEYSIAIPMDTSPDWAVALIKHLTRYVLQSGMDLTLGDAMPCNAPITCAAFQPEHHAMMPKTALVAIACTTDPLVPSVDTPRGPIEVRRFVGLHQDELDLIQTWSANGFIEEYRAVDPLLLCKLDRASALQDEGFVTRCHTRRADEPSEFPGFVLEAHWTTDGQSVSLTLPARPQSEKLLAGLRGRLPYGRSLSLYCPGCPPIVFEPGSGLSIQPSAEHLLITGSLEDLDVIIQGLGHDSPTHLQIPLSQ